MQTWSNRFFNSIISNRNNKEMGKGGASEQEPTDQLTRIHNKQKQIQDLVTRNANSESIRKAQEELGRLVGGSGSGSDTNNYQFRQMIFRKN